MSKVWLKFFRSYLGITLMALAIGSPALAATLEFSPATGSHATNQTFNVEVKVNTGGQDTTSTDAVIIFDNKLLSVDNVTYGSFYSTVLHSEQNGKLYISGMVDSAGVVKSGTGTLATVSFKGLTAGTATLSFECEAGRTDDSNVSKNDVDSTDIIDCTALADASYTLTGASVPTVTPEPGAGTTDPADDLPTTGNGTTGTGTGTGAGTATAPGTGAPATIPNTGFADFLQLAPKLAMGILFIVAGLIPLLI